MLAKSHTQPPPLTMHDHSVLADGGFEETVSSGTVNTPSVECSKVDVCVAGFYQEVFLSLLAGPSPPFAVSLWFRGPFASLSDGTKQGGGRKHADATVREREMGERVLGCCCDVHL